MNTKSLRSDSDYFRPTRSRLAKNLDLVLFAIRFTWDLEWIVPNDFEDQTIQNIIMTNPHIGDIRFAIFYDYAQRFNLDRKSC